jgi:hypothetical protein
VGIPALPYDASGAIVSLRSKFYPCRRTKAQSTKRN